jgi:hypothetical protein
MKTARATQNGSAFFIILVAIMMFAMLSYAVSQGSRSSASGLTAEQANVAAQEITSYGSGLSKAVQTLRLRGCTVEEISFESMPVAGNANPVSPADGSCDVYDLAGGKSNYNAPSSNWLDITEAGEDGYGEWVFTNQSCIPGVGSGGTGCANASEMEILMVLPWVKREVCSAVNKLANWASYDSLPIPTAGGAAYDYTEKVNGVFQNGTDIDTSDNRIDGERVLCFQGAGSNPAGGYHVYFVLLTR